MRKRRGKMSNSNSDRESRPPKATTIRAHVLLFVFKCPFQTHLSLWPLLLITFQKNPQLFHICFLLFALLFYFLEAMSTLALGKRKPPWLNTIIVWTIKGVLLIGAWVCRADLRLILSLLFLQISSFLEQLIQEDISENSNSFKMNTHRLILGNGIQSAFSLGLLFAGLWLSLHIGYECLSANVELLSKWKTIWHAFLPFYNFEGGFLSNASVISLLAGGLLILSWASTKSSVAWNPFPSIHLFRARYYAIMALSAFVLTIFANMMSCYRLQLLGYLFLFLIQINTIFFCYSLQTEHYMERLIGEHLFFDSYIQISNPISLSKKFTRLIDRLFEAYSQKHHQTHIVYNIITSIIMRNRWFSNDKSNAYLLPWAISLGYACIPKHCQNPDDFCEYFINLFDMLYRLEKSRNHLYDYILYGMYFALLKVKDMNQKRADYLRMIKKIENYIRRKLPEIEDEHNKDLVNNYQLCLFQTLSPASNPPKLSCDYNQNTAVMRFVFSEALTDGINYGLPLTAFYDYEVSA